MITPRKTIRHPFENQLVNLSVDQSVDQSENLSVKPTRLTTRKPTRTPFEPHPKRIWLTDFIRGIAILMVVIFHLAFNLSYFYEWESIDIYHGFWFYEGKIAAILFMLMVGVVTAIINQKKSKIEARRIHLKRVTRLLGISLVITLITWLIFPKEIIWFGILHLMGMGILISIPLARFKWLNILLGVGIFALNTQMGWIEVSTQLLLPFGLKPNTFASLDYYPLIPWFGVILIGTGLGNLLYKKIVQLKSPQTWQKPFNYLGKHSLVIYLAHQPILLGLLWLIFK